LISLFLIGITLIIIAHPHKQRETETVVNTVTINKQVG